MVNIRYMNRITRLLFITLLSLLVGCSKSSGTHRGVITEVGVEGAFNRTSTVQIQSGTGHSELHYELDIVDENVKTQLAEFERTGQEVIVTYDCVRFITMFSPNYILTREHPCLLTGVELK